MPVTQKMLTQTLKTLERDGLLTRSAYATIPPRVDYELTELGRSVRVLLDAIREWSEDHIPDILAAREAYDQRAAEDPRPVA
jgi:DNA-binding HxlR family transcriptional regulator